MRLVNDLLSFPAALLLLGSTLADEPKVEPKAADADAPLAKGFPDATAPGKVEVKRYPAYRGAIVADPKGTIASGDSLFFPLFRHIVRNKVEMTAPVINTYKTPAIVETPGGEGEVTMEFVYRTPETGEIGDGKGGVKVVDHPSARFLCLGVQGAMSGERMRESIETLRGWLAEHRGEWAEDGPPRRIGYHGPMTEEARRLWEVQIPVKPAKDDPPK